MNLVNFCYNMLKYPVMSPRHILLLIYTAFCFLKNVINMCVRAYKINNFNYICSYVVTLILVYKLFIVFFNSIFPVLLLF